MLYLTIIARKSKVVKHIDVIDLISERNIQGIRMKLILMDSSILHVRETIVGKENVYSYHWQKPNGKLIIRWDNKPHWKVKTFPHHKHMGDDKKVKDSFETTLEDVLKFIEDKIEWTQRKRES